MNCNRPKKLIQRVRSLETWERADWLLKYKSPIETRWGTTQLTAGDFLPFCLGFFKVILGFLPIGSLLYIFWFRQKIVFFLLAGLSIPIALIILKLMDYFIKKYIVMNN